MAYCMSTITLTRSRVYLGFRVNGFGAFLGLRRVYQTRVSLGFGLGPTLKALFQEGSSNVGP